MLFQGCYIPQKAWYEFGKVTLEEIHKNEIGFDLIWYDGKTERLQFVKDTTGCDYHLGMTYLVMLKK